MNINEDENILQACACAKLRTVARSLTQLYDQLLQPTGLKITQYYMLVNIYQYKQLSISALSDVMKLNQTTITRNVNVLVKNKLVQVKKDDKDSRSKEVFLTSSGIQKLQDASAVWVQVQKKIEEDIGTEDYQHLTRNLAKVQRIVADYE